MNKVRIHPIYMALIAGLVTAQSIAAAADKPEESKEKGLIAILQSDAPPQAKAITCKQLAICGTKAAVPALASLLSDEKLASWARIGLEAIPDPAADDALRDTLGKLQGKLLIGVINSIGKRGDVKAVEWLSQKLKDNDPALAAASAAALGRIGGEQAANALEKALDKASAETLPAICEGCLRCADNLVARDKSDKAVKIFKSVLETKTPRHIRMEAMRGLIVAKQDAGIPLLIEQLKSDDAGMVAIAMGLAHEMPDPKLTKALLKEVTKLPPEKQVYVINALAVRQDKSVVPTLLSLAKNGSTNVCIAAIGALSMLVDASTLPQLVEIAVSPDSEISRAAQSAIIGFPAADADTTGTTMLASKDARVRVIGAEVINRRMILSALPAVAKAAREDTDQAVRVASINALRDLGKPDDLSCLVDIVLNNKSPEEVQAAERAMATICGKQTDTGLCSEKLAAGLATAQPAQKCALLRILRSVGDSRSLQAVRAAMSDANAEVKDAATRLICNWNTADASADMLALAKNSTNSTYKLLGLRGYIRVIAGKEVSAEQRLIMCKEATALVQRDDERRILLGVLGSTADAELLRIASSFIDNAVIKEEACLAAVAIAERLPGDTANACIPDMEKVLKNTRNKKVTGRVKKVLEEAKAKK